MEIYLVDKNGTVLPYADNVVTINVSGAGKFIGEKEIALEGGTAAFFIQSLYNETGIVTAEVSADGLESVTCEIEAVSFDEKTVPVAESEGTQTPLMQQYTDYNDSDAIFEYSVGWTSCDQGGCYMNDNTYSNAAGATVTVKFTGDRLVWYGSTAPSHGIMILNLDGEEQEIDCYSEERRDSVVIFDSGEIENTEHTLTVTVTGRENDLATDRFINVDRVRVYQTK